MSFGDIYTAHLSQLNKDNKVVSTEDIYNDKGALLLKKNSLIDDKATVVLVKHKLKKSISLCVSIENALDEKLLYNEFLHCFKKFPDIHLIHQKLALKKHLQIGCLYYKEFPLLRQKMTVMQHNMPELFEKSIIGAWYAVALGKQLEISNFESKQMFVAALIRDLGMMHIDPDLFNSPDTAPETKRQLLMSHVVIAKLVLDEARIPLAIKKSVLEHHERCDGAGYPSGKQGSELSLSGQIIAMSDTVQELFIRNSRQGKNIANLEGFLNLNTTTYGEKVYYAMVRLVRLSECKPIRHIPSNNFLSYIQMLLETNVIFMALCKNMKELADLLNSTNPIKEEVVLKNFISRIVNMQITSGVPSQEYGRWMEFVQSNEVRESYPEIEVLGAMFEEIAWQADQIKFYISVLWDKPYYSDSIKSKLKECMSIISRAIKLTQFKEKRG
ncbi:HD-GYP domain-containing protein [Aliikangiella sp. IMCC44359]|uniref:HD-GYP domain-containing protein n=1 Tax=Aliikangiella sp. IMCC44359 TaxID=3459125 RepID=UPI00403AAB9E